MCRQSFTRSLMQNNAVLINFVLNPELMTLIYPLKNVNSIAKHEKRVEPRVIHRHDRISIFHELNFF